MSETERHEVVDKAGNEKEMIGWPVGMKEFDIPTGTSDLDWRCPECGEIGHYSRTGYPNPSCTNLDCRVDKFSPHVRNRNNQQDAAVSEQPGGDGA